MNADGSGPTNLTKNAAGSDLSPAWSPAPRTRILVGAGGLLQGSVGVGGLLFSQSGKVTDSCVVFDATTRSSIVMTSQSVPNNTGPNLVYSVDADKVTLISYLSNPDYQAVRVVGTGVAISYASGALISLDSGDGSVTTVLPFLGTRTAGKPSITQSNGERVYSGSFLGVFDSKGKNLAPKGAREVHTNSTTGKVTSIK